MFFHFYQRSKFYFCTVLYFIVSKFSEYFRTQKLAREQNEKIEAVNRERKYHQVILISSSHLMFCSITILTVTCLIFPFFFNAQQNTAYELNALSAQWKELCQKNIEIQEACIKIENQIEELKRESSER